MFTTIVCYNGERWDQVATRCYGDALQGSALMDANPGVSIDDRLAGGVVLQVPIVADAVNSAVVAGLPPWKQA